MSFLIKLMAVVLLLNFSHVGNAEASSRILLRPNEQMVPDQHYFSPNGRYFAVFQGFDGNLVVYRGPDRTAQGVLWASGARMGTTAIFQWDANFVIYKGSITPSNAVWASNTNMTPNDQAQPYVAIDDNGSLYATGYGATVKWKTPADPYAVETCTTVRQYPICVFAGTRNQFTSVVLACSAADAQRQAAATGAVYGACPF